MDGTGITTGINTDRFISDSTFTGCVAIISNLFVGNARIGDLIPNKRRAREIRLGRAHFLQRLTACASNRIYFSISVSGTCA